MKTLFSAILLTIGFSASAVEVTFKCSPRAYDCTPNGVCRWYEIYEGVPTTIRLDPSHANPGLYFARYQTTLDNHQLTLDFRYEENEETLPLRVNAYLGATNVMAESSGTNRIDISLRNNVFGRGFVCTQIRARP